MEEMYQDRQSIFNSNDEESVNLNNVENVYNVENIENVNSDNHVDENVFLTFKRFQKRETSQKLKQRLCDAAQELVTIFFFFFSSYFTLFLLHKNFL
jgi:Icc-related predicted phosphoesterase